VAWQDDEALGFIKFAPARYFPQSRHFAAGPIDPDMPMLACLHIRDDARRLGLGSVLLKAALRDLTLRGGRHVYAFAASPGIDVVSQPVVGVEFLLRNGFTVANPHPSYPLLKLDLRSLATWAENLDALLQALRIPLASPQRLPSPSIKCKESHK
jgi:GNAT superfamily N-acetyltransferase